MARVTAEEVRKILDHDPTIDIAPFIAMATAQTDAIAAADDDSVMTVALLIQIEKMLAAHYYGMLDPLVKEETVGHTRTQAKYNGRSWWDEAVKLDATGYLASGGIPRPSIVSLDLPPSERTDYVDRD